MINLPPAEISPRTPVEPFLHIMQSLQLKPKRWLITGVAGFIGSHLLEHLLQYNQNVVGLDNFSTGFQANLDEVQSIVGPAKWQNFSFMQGDIRDLQTCHVACEGVDYILHQAALGSVPRSLQDPITTNSVNIDGFLNMLVAARDAKITHFTYAGSSSTYGDHDALPKIEERIGNPLSPYAVTKYVNELYAGVFARSYGLNTIGLRYFNVFGPRQNPNGAYAAVIPKWIAAMIQQQDISIYGDGSTSRDFSYIENVVQANILAATAGSLAKNHIYNIAFQDSTTLNQLFEYLKKELANNGQYYPKSPIYQDNRPGDVKHSLADINKAKTLLGYAPQYNIQMGIEKAMPWYLNRLRLETNRDLARTEVIHDTIIS